MAMTCKEQQERVEETVLQPIDQWVEQQEQRCSTEPCNWWMLCLNKVVCWVVTTLVKVTLWVTTLDSRLSEVRRLAIARLVELSDLDGQQPTRRVRTASELLRDLGIERRDQHRLGCPRPDRPFSRAGRGRQSSEAR